MWVDTFGNLYEGDCRAGDRAATPEEVAAWEQSRSPSPLQQILELEAQQVRDMARFDREQALASAEALALAEFGIEPEDLYAMGAGPNPPTAALNYRRLKDLDNQIKALRDQL
ncbi:hypothetical protein AEP_00512 [Curvibacter sp. AEP1-3]|uniref:hypothetical protein n=1 Tax=Curvibacter sp. AEP1-3 TaxID=1844971 RepID=UPI000B3C6123|nr:hypothetical protein [Curvibacter sp. AEP1-3]ARV17472.1 hypothetical protein AEP_00512 [Curvibacter sp. AEP1-3]